MFSGKELQSVLVLSKNELRKTSVFVPCFLHPTPFVVRRARVRVMVRVRVKVRGFVQ
jgi:hypothetical protein